jgi:hypothetical protein
VSFSQGSCCRGVGHRRHQQGSQHQTRIIHFRPCRAQAVVFLPALHLVASLFKRYAFGTYQGSIHGAHLPFYLPSSFFGSTGGTREVEGSCSTGSWRWLSVKHPFATTS